MPALHPEFTLHDERHFLRVTELMALVINDTLSVLNPVEVALLILAAYFHDQGMVPDSIEFAEIERSDDYVLHSQLWRSSHPNLAEIEDQLGSTLINAEERSALALKQAELLHAMKADFVRQSHADRSAAMVRNRFANDRRLELFGVPLNDLLARLCSSHVLPPTDVRPENGYHHDVLVGAFAINLRYLAVVLRLADILDFDRERTPDPLFRTIHFTSEVSIAEWEKHRAVRGWTIGPDLIRFDMAFEHPVYERLARLFLDWIDYELVSAHEIFRSFPKPFCDSYRQSLPQRVDRSRVGPRDGKYVYQDLEFTMSRDEIVKLLMTEKLYRSPSLAIRELVQNALDALRYRRALFQLDGIEWKDGNVSIEHRLDDHGRDVIACRDNGVGMDELVITKFLTNVGRSYYRSPYFEQERIRLRANGADFDPCSRFGIGFMSCFMLGDHIRIETRRDYGPGKKYGNPWIVEVNGLSGMVVLRGGADDQPVGTTVTVFGRDPQVLVDEFSDHVRVVPLIRGYCLATEFPIHAICSIDRIKDRFDCPTEHHIPQTKLESLAIRQIVSFEQSFSAIDKRLGGTVRESFLVDSSGMPTRHNDAAKWVKGDNFRTPSLELTGECPSQHSVLDEKHAFDQGASSAESVGEVWLGKCAKGVI